MKNYLTRKQRYDNIKIEVNLMLELAGNFY